MLLFFLIVQVIFESLPVSSSGHVHIFSVANSLAVEYFLHLCAAAIFFAYLVAQRSEMFAWWKSNGHLYWMRYGFVLGVTALATGSALLAKRMFFVGVENFNGLISSGFLITSIALLSLLLVPKRNDKRVPTLWDALFFSIAQSIALFLPGASRMALVFVAARWCGWSNRGALYWMIALALPLFFGAGLLGLYAGGAHQLLVTFGWLFLLLMLLVSCFSGLLFFLVAYLARTNRLWWFGVYTLLLALFLFFNGATSI